MERIKTANDDNTRVIAIFIIPSNGRIAVSPTKIHGHRRKDNGVVIKNNSPVLGADVKIRVNHYGRVAPLSRRPAAARPAISSVGSISGSKGC